MCHQIWNISSWQFLSQYFFKEFILVFNLMETVCVCALCVHSCGGGMCGMCAIVCGMCMHSYRCSCICACKYSLEVNLRCHSSGSVHLDFSDRVSYRLWAHLSWLVRLVGSQHLGADFILSYILLELNSSPHSYIARTSLAKHLCNFSPGTLDSKGIISHWDSV